MTQLNCITGSVSNEPGLVKWLKTMYSKTVRKLTTFWPMNISFWPKHWPQHSIFTFHYFNAELHGKYCQTPVWQLCDSCQILNLINFQNNLAWPNSNTAGISLDSRLKYIKLTYFGYHKFSLQATIDHHGPSIYSGHYTTSVNCCNRTFYCNDNKITEFDMINTKNSFTAYVVIYKLIT